MISRPCSVGPQSDIYLHIPFHIAWAFLEYGSSITKILCFWLLEQVNTPLGRCSCKAFYAPCLRKHSLWGVKRTWMKNDNLSVAVATFWSLHMLWMIPTYSQGWDQPNSYFVNTRYRAGLELQRGNTRIQNAGKQMARIPGRRAGYLPTFCLWCAWLDSTTCKHQNYELNTTKMIILQISKTEV